MGKPQQTCAIRGKKTLIKIPVAGMKMTPRCFIRNAIDKSELNTALVKGVIHMKDEMLAAPAGQYMFNCVNSKNNLTSNQMFEVFPSSVKVTKLDPSLTTVAKPNMTKVLEKYNGGKSKRPIPMDKLAAIDPPNSIWVNVHGENFSNSSGLR